MWDGRNNEPPTPLWAERYVARSRGGPCVVRTTAETPTELGAVEVLIIEREGPPLVRGTTGEQHSIGPPENFPRTPTPSYSVLVTFLIGIWSIDEHDWPP